MQCIYLHSETTSLYQWRQFIMVARAVHWSRLPTELMKLTETDCQQPKLIPSSVSHEFLFSEPNSSGLSGK